ncbi:hypothetical protein [Nocardia salmonicida]|uniref:hypothetical protein n=1 Tax=Nocardia salmonicida TaxID=53431 RepID=UPI003633DF10
MVDANAMRRNLSEALGMTMRGLIDVMFGRSASVTADDPDQAAELSGGVRARCRA